MTEEASVHDLLVRYKGGQIEALETLYDSYWERFQRYGVRQGLAAEAAMDVAHDVFERVVDRIETYGGERDGIEQQGGERWLWRICRNEVNRVLGETRREGLPLGQHEERQESRAGRIWPDPLWAEAWHLGPEFVRCLVESFAGLSPFDQKVIRNRDPDHDPGREPQACRRWRDALWICYGDADGAEGGHERRNVAGNRAGIQNPG